MNDSSSTSLIGSPREVPVASIERELAALWTDTSGYGDGVHPVVRACSLNFVVLSETSAQLDEIAAMVGDVAAEHPGRVFLVEINRRAQEPEMEAWISARCSLPLPGEKQVCCEQITLLASGGDVAKVPSVITSLLVADVPTVLLWKAPLTQGNELFTQLLKIADRILIDTSEHCDPELLLTAWGGFLAVAEDHISLCDLSWTHITAWRDMVANAFQPPEVRGSVHHITSVLLRYSSTSSPAHSGLSQGLLLIGWLADRLSWSVRRQVAVENAQARSLSFASQDGETRVRLELVPPSEQSSGQIESLEIEAGPDVKLGWVVKAGRDAVEFTRRLPGREIDRQVFPVRNQSEAALVAIELEVLQQDVIYERSMMLLRKLLPASES